MVGRTRSPSKSVTVGGRLRGGVACREGYGLSLMALGKDNPRSASETCFRDSSPKIYRCGKYSYGSSDCNREQE
jgi:hypothetical protein